MSRILIVEDEAHLADGLRFNLEAEGHQVDIDGDGQQALDRLLANRSLYDAVVLDVMLPGKDGFAVVKQLRSEGHYRERDRAEKTDLEQRASDQGELMCVVNEASASVVIFLGGPAAKPHRSSLVHEETKRVEDEVEDPEGDGKRGRLWAGETTSHVSDDQTSEGRRKSGLRRAT